MQKSYEPKNAFDFFREISLIPRGSGNEKGISDYLAGFARERSLWVHQDKALNVIIKKAGAGGLEKSLPVIIQGHMDMVCEKNEDTRHDFKADPIKLVLDGDIVKTDGTTLGADNGVALAMALAILDSNDIPHPPLEVLFTSGEEVGLLGAAEIDGGLFEGKMLINMDSSTEGYFFASCAGGARVELAFAEEYCEVPPGYISKSIKIKGLKGGHSGIDIGKERGNSNRLLARMLNILHSKFDIYFTDINGGLKENAIAREAGAVICFNGGQLSAVEDAVKEIEQIFKREYSLSDDGLEIIMTDCEKACEKVFTKQLCRNILTALLTIPNGIEAMSLVFDGLPETSLNIGVVAAKEGKIAISSSLRSSVSSRKEMLVDQLKLIAEATGAETNISGVYPAWEYNEKSILREKAVKVYREHSGKEAVICGTHGGLECGILSGKISGVDIISFGPDINEMHTPNENMSISSFWRTWEFLKKLLAALA